MKKKNPCYLFVYGTLRKSFDSPIHKKIAGSAEWIGSAFIQGKLFDIGDYPGALPSTKSEGSKIKGELIRVNDEEKVMKILDEYEGFDRDNPNNSEYSRRMEQVTLENGEGVMAWVYWYNGSVQGKNMIADTDYLNYLKNRSRTNEI